MLTFFSGFGLGTLLLPAMALFFPLPVAIGATAIVHFSNGLFKFGLVYKGIHFPTLIRFAIPAFVFAIIGSLTLNNIESWQFIYHYHWFGRMFEVTGLKIIIGVLMLIFAAFDILPKLKNLSAPQSWMSVGGAITGFFGGISGHQGAFRSAFLNKSGLTKEQFVGTSNAISLIIDISRIAVYAKTLDFVSLSNEKTLIIVAVLLAFSGTLVGNRYLKKMTMGGIRTLVGVFLILMGIAMIAGLI